MAQPTSHVIYVPYVPIAFVYVAVPVQDEPQQRHAQELDLEDTLNEMDYDQEIERFIKLEEKSLKDAYHRKLFKTVLQGEIYTQPSVKK